MKLFTSYLLVCFHPFWSPSTPTPPTTHCKHNSTSCFWFSVCMEGLVRMTKEERMTAMKSSLETLKGIFKIFCIELILVYMFVSFSLTLGMWSPFKLCCHSAPITKYLWLEGVFFKTHVIQTKFYGGWSQLTEILCLKLEMATPAGCTPIQGRLVQQWTLDAISYLHNYWITRR